MLTPAKAGAHPLSATAILLNTGSDQVTGQLQLPIDRLAIALNQPLTPAAVTDPGTLGELQRYVAVHTSATDPTDGTPWHVSITGGRVEKIDGVDHLVVDLALRPQNGAMRDFELHYDAIVHRLLSHRVFVSSRAAGSDTYTAVGLIDWQSHTLTVPVRGVTAPQQGFLAALKLGVTHIAEGADHLLFLVMLLLPAPLAGHAGRWFHAPGYRRRAVRVVHVVTAFAVGHSATLALAALGFVTAPTRIVECLIAVSILVSAVHALKPLARGGEVWIAAGFGLVHGLAFATLLTQLDLGRRSLLTELVGFNLGIEVSQLLVVALIMPSLVVLSATRAYPVFRIALASGGIILAGSWLAERSSAIDTNPLDGVSEALVAHPFIVAATLALIAVIVWTVPSLRNPAARPPGAQEASTLGQGPARVA